MFSVAPLAVLFVLLAALSRALSIEHAPRDGVLPQRGDIVLAGGEDRTRVVLVAAITRVRARALHCALQRWLLRHDGAEGTCVGTEGGEDALPAAAGAYANVVGSGGAWREELGHELLLDREEGGEAHADAAVAVVERGCGKADAGRRGRAACDALALGDGGRGGRLGGSVPLFLEDLEEALHIARGARGGVGGSRE